MSEIRVTRRYAKALIDLGRERNMLEEIHMDAQKFLEICNDNRQLVLMLKSPIIHLEKKNKITHRIFADMLSEESGKFIRMIIRKNRAALLREIFQQVVAQYREFKGIADATVYSSIELPEGIHKDIEQQLTTDSTTVELKNVVDKNLIGGFVLRYGDKLIDASVASHLKALRKELTN